MHLPLSDTQRANLTCRPPTYEDVATSRSVFGAPPSPPRTAGLRHTRGCTVRAPYALLAAALAVVVGVGVTLCAIHWPR